VAGVHLGDSLPRHVRHGPASGYLPGEFHLDRVDAGDVVHDDADGAGVARRHGRVPVVFREPFDEGGQAGRPLLNAFSQ
jgi:hypothetical protein